MQIKMECLYTLKHFGLRAIPFSFEWNPAKVPSIRRTGIAFLDINGKIEKSITSLTNLWNLPKTWSVENIYISVSKLIKKIKICNNHYKLSGSRWWARGGTPSYGLYRDVPQDRVSFFTSLSCPLCPLCLCPLSCFCGSALTRVCNFVWVCKQGIACMIDLICNMNFVYTPSIQKPLTWNCSIALKQDGVHFLLCAKQGNKIEGVALNRVS